MQSITKNPPTPLIPRSTVGLALYLYQMLDDLASGKPVDKPRIDGACRIINTLDRVRRTEIQEEKHKLTGATGLVINHEDKGA